MAQRARAAAAAPAARARCGAPRETRGGAARALAGAPGASCCAALEVARGGKEDGQEARHERHLQGNRGGG